MKKSQLKRLAAIYSTIEQAKSDLEEIAQELQDAIDEKSEKWQEGEKGQAAAEEQNHVESAASNAELTLDELGSLEGLGDAS